MQKLKTNNAARQYMHRLLPTGTSPEVYSVPYQRALVRLFTLHFVPTLFAAEFEFVDALL